MNNALIETGAGIYKGRFSLRFAPKPEDKYVPKNYSRKRKMVDFRYSFYQTAINKNRFAKCL